MHSSGRNRKIPDRHSARRNRKNLIGIQPGEKAKTEETEKTEKNALMKISFVSFTKITNFSAKIVIL